VSSSITPIASAEGYEQEGRALGNGYFGATVGAQ
jgi:hypothetical protein